jgi:hypothetical protein
MRTLAVIFVLALIAIAGGICSDPVLMSGTAPHADPDPVALAVAHAVKSRPESRPWGLGNLSPQLSSASEKSPHHDRVVAKDRDDEIDRERYHHFNG